MKCLSRHTRRNHLSGLLDEVSRGAEISITRNGGTSPWR